MHKRYRRGSIKSRPISAMNVVPYIDVMLVLLVIFMVTAPLLSQGIQVQLPHTQAQALNPKAEMPIIISVDAKGALFLNDNPTPQQAIPAQSLVNRVAALLSIAKQNNKARAVYVKGDRKATYGQVARAMALLQSAGAKEIGLITEATHS